MTRHIRIDPSELTFEFYRASGPGGQNVNKVSTAVRLRFNVLRSRSLPAEVKGRLTRQLGRRLTADGTLVIEAKRYRTQERNRREALERLTALVERGWQAERKRVATGPSRASVERRLKLKKSRAQAKRRRAEVPEQELE